jgi:hypothetical protein
MSKPPEGSAEHVLDEACVVRHLSPDGTPRELLQKVLDWETALALTPAVSKEAHDLYLKGYNDAVRHIETVIGWLPPGVTRDNCLYAIKTCFKDV